MRIEGDEAGSASVGKTAKWIQLLLQEGTSVTADVEGSGKPSTMGPEHLCTLLLGIPRI